jgi:hypothetical protein
LRRVLLAFAATGISVAAFVLVLRAQTSATEPESGASASFDSVRLVERGVDLGRFLEQHHLGGLHPARSVYRPPKGAPRPAAGRQAAAERLAARIRARERNPGQVVAYTLQLHGYERTGVHLRWEVHDAQTGKVAEQDVADPYEQVVIRNRDETIANDVWVPSPPSGGRYFIKIAAWRVAQTKDPHRLEVVVIAGGDTGDFDAP